MRTNTCLVAAALAVSICGCASDSPLPLSPSSTSSRSADNTGHRTVVVNPNAHGNGVAQSVQEGLEMVADGGTVLLMPGTYNERILIDKEVTLTSIGAGADPAILKDSQPTSALATEAVVSIGTAAPVVLRDIAIVHHNIRGINILRDADVLVERVGFSGVSTAATLVGNGVTAHYNAGTSGKRARVIVRESRFSVGGTPISFGGDVDGVIQQNEMRQAVGRLICVIISPVGQGGTMLTVPGSQTNVDVVDNLFEDCGANILGRYNAINVVGSPGATTGGTVNVVGNMIRNTAPDGCMASGIQYEHYTGVIEHNTLVNVIQACSPAVSTRGFRSAIFVGSRIAGIRPANVAVRFNDISGNEYAGLRIGSNQPAPIDATCNWWGAATGPSSAGATENRDAIVVQPGGGMPTFTPFASAPIAHTADASCQ